MKIIIGIILIYVLAVLVSTFLFKYIWNSLYKGTEHETNWKSPLNKFSIIYLMTGVIFFLLFSIVHFFFN